MIARGGQVVAVDVGADPDPTRVWGRLDCQGPLRHRRLSTGGDPARRADGVEQGSPAFRRLRAIDGDDFYGERCELGRNESRYGSGGGSGTFQLYQEGERKVTFFSQRYPEGFDPDVDTWQTVMQMKQTQPYEDDGNVGVALELQISGGRLRLYGRWSEMWSTPAPPANTWVRYALDVVYSADPSIGTVTLYVDRNGDGDWLDAGERSPQLSMVTLATERSGPDAGTPIPSHLRLGIYHDPLISCPPPTGCPVDIDNVQVIDLGATSLADLIPAGLRP